MREIRRWPLGRLVVSAAALIAVAVGLITPAAPAADGAAQIAVKTGSDDAEQLVTGWIGTTSSDLELVDEAIEQLVGIRFVDVPVPRGATITAASIQFTVDEVSVDPADLLIAAHDTGSAPAFGTAQPIIGRPVTTGVVWSPEPWALVGDRGPAQRTPDLAPVLQAIVNRSDWAPGQAVAFIVTGTGRRTAESYEGGAPPVLTISWTTEPTTTTTTTTTVSTTTTVPTTTTTTTTVATTTTVPSTTTTSTTTSTTTTTTVPTTTTTTTVPGSTSGTAQVTIGARNDDVEELSSGWIYASSSDLELVEDDTVQTVGLRFTGVEIPPGATILAASVQFTVDEVSTGPSDLVIRAERVGDSIPLTTTLTTRPTTTAAVAWAPPPWTTVGAAGSDQRTPDLSALVAEVTSLPSWASGNALTFVITGSGTRTAESFDGVPAAAPRLTVDWVIGPRPPVPNTPPTVTATGTGATAGGSTTLTAFVADDGLPDPPGELDVDWEQVTGPAIATIQSGSSLEATALLPLAGEYGFVVTVSDGEFETSATVVVTAIDAPAPSGTTRIAAIADYGGPTARMFALEALIDLWGPDAIVTAGDNVYSDRGFDRLVGRFFHDYIGGYTGAYGVGAEPPGRFFPALGNHDYEDGGLGAYLAFFDLPGTERYYDVRIGVTHVFIVNSNPQEPDGLTPTTVQGRWLQSAMASSDARWKIVVFHHPTHSSIRGKAAQWMRWPLAEWGADLVINGDAHAYERLTVDGVPHIVNGLGINNTQLDGPRIPESDFFWSQDTPGALFITACDSALELEMRTVSAGVIDSLLIGSQACP